MKLLRMLLAVTLLGVLAGVAYVGQATEPAGAKMATAADKLLAVLSPEQKQKATFAFEDKERLRWFFTPQQDATRKTTRKGLPLQDMKADQREAALSLLRAGTSAGGYVKATTIMSLEAILNELEKGGRMVRDPEWYFFTVFGAPSKTGKWGWRVEGHHLALNFTMDGSRVVSATPAFFGANPATIKDGPKKGSRTHPEAEDLAKELITSLDDSQKKAAQQEKQFGEIQENTPAPKLGEPKGLLAAKMTEPQRGLLSKLIEAYARRMPADIADEELTGVRKAGIENVHFAFAHAGGLEPGKPYTYRVQGPTFVIEFVNVQADSAKNPANHIHSAWRNIKGDFGQAN